MNKMLTYNGLKLGDMVISKLVADNPQWWMLVKKAADKLQPNIIVLTWIHSCGTQEIIRHVADEISPTRHTVMRDGEVLL